MTDADDDPLKFRFEPRWKEEIVCTCQRGSFVLEMSMGIDTVWLPTEAAWPAKAPEWAVDCWPTLHVQLEAWCKAHRIPLRLDETTYVFDGA